MDSAIWRAIITFINQIFDKKQDKLIAGTGITIDDNNVISAGGGDGIYGYYVDMLLNYYDNGIKKNVAICGNIVSKINLNLDMQESLLYYNQIIPNIVFETIKSSCGIYRDGVWISQRPNLRVYRPNVAGDLINSEIICDSDKIDVYMKYIFENEIKGINAECYYNYIDNTAEITRIF